jgi:hypothetical protein
MRSGLLDSVASPCLAISYGPPNFSRPILNSILRRIQHRRMDCCRTTSRGSADCSGFEQSGGFQGPLDFRQRRSTQCLLANRLNLFWDLDWEGIPERLDTTSTGRCRPGSRLCRYSKTRAAITKCAEDWSEVDYWLDLGNNAEAGQFILGEPLNRRNRRHRLRLRTVSDLFSEVIQ